MSRVSTVLLFSFQVLFDGEGRKKKTTSNRLHLHWSVQLTHGHSRFCPSKTVTYVCICSGKVLFEYMHTICNLN